MGKSLSFVFKSFYSNFKFVCTTGMGEQGDDFTDFTPVSFEPKTPQASMESPHGWQRIAKTWERTYGD